MKISIDWLKELVDLNCSIEELIKLLPLKTIGLKEVTAQYIELDMKGYNRADLLSLRGVAYEVSAITNSRVYFGEPHSAEFVWNQKNLPQIPVTVKDNKFCTLYCLTKIEKVKVNKSSAEVIRKLEESGMRSVNNIADITNLVMLEYGQPLHAFDAKKVENEEIIVRFAKNGEEIITLDGKKRKLSSSDLLITDPKKAVGIAGVMGGENSEVTNQTETILLEAAIFDPVSIRKTTTSLGLPSEAAKRFQHGLSKKRLLQALDAAIKMYQVLGGRLVAINIVGKHEDQTKKINLTKDKLDALVGISFNKKQVEDYLKGLGFKLASQGSTLRGWEVEVPYSRLDINIEEDVIEEVARMYGYEKIPPSRVLEIEPLQKEDVIFKEIADFKKKLVELGLTEVQTYSFYSTDVLDALGFTQEYKKFLVKIANPISSETEYLRMNLWPNLVEVVGRNIRRGYNDIGIFEVGKSYHQLFDGKGEPQEVYALSIALYNGTDNPIEELLSLVKEMGLNIKLNSAPVSSVVTNLFHPKRFVHLEKEGKEIGGMGEVHLRVLNKLGIEKRIAVLEIELESNRHPN